MPNIELVPTTMTVEEIRLLEDQKRENNWKRWGPYLSDRQWGTVREDYSPDGACWDYFPHDHSRSRAYRWGEDGLLGITDRECRLCFSLALWNTKDAILKERLFGLTGPEGNHGEDVKECYYYLRSLPSHAYMQALYKYPQGEFPYAQLVAENRKRDKNHSEFELLDTGLFDENRYFDVFAEYAKDSPNDILIRITIFNRAPITAPIHIVPSLWFRNTWSWGRIGEGYTGRPSLKLLAPGKIISDHETLEPFIFLDEVGMKTNTATPLFTENETNIEKLFKSTLGNPYVKDAFHNFVIHNKTAAVNPAHEGTKAAFHHQFELPAGGQATLKFRLCAKSTLPSEPFEQSFDDTFDKRIKETDEFYQKKFPPNATAQEKLVMEQAYAGLLWTKQFYYYSVSEWAEGDPTQPTPADSRKRVRNVHWKHIYNRDIISMPDKWEYPWYAAWDLAFHMIPFCKIDPEFAKQQLLLFLREWYMHPNGQIPAYEFAFNDVNPPVHAWACWRVYKITAGRGQRDRSFLARAFHKLLLNFTWWVNRKDIEGNNLFSGGFLGLDNIGVFDRSQPLPTGGHLEQADATAWMAFYCATMLSIALELAKEDPSYEDVASKFFEHFISITDAINTLGGTGLWDDLDGFYYDQLHVDGKSIPLRIRSLVGIIPILAVEVLEDDTIDRLPGFAKRMRWFLNHRQDLARHISYMESSRAGSKGLRLLAVPSRARLERMLQYILDENEFLAPYGIRSLSKIHKEQPYVFKVGSQDYRVGYVPGESTTVLFGGNSNWRGPVWFPINYVLIEALERYHHFYGDSLLVEFPKGTSRKLNLREVSQELASRHTALFLPTQAGLRPCHGNDPRYANDPNWKNLVLFYEYFHGDNGKGFGANHQTGWTALATRCIEKLDASWREKK